jgi:NADH-quinone oxidoreductase subunit H
VFKLLFKEVIQPTNAQPVPVPARAADGAGAGVRGLGGGAVRRRLVLSDANAGLLYLLAMTSMGVYGVIIAGWASNSKYAFLGAMRSAAQVVSLRDRDGLRPGRRAGRRRQPEPDRDRATAQAGDAGFFEWFWLPLLPLFVIYFISGVAETNRAPFDVAEGESEIVAGFHVEYSGAAFALFFLAEYANMILISFLTAICSWAAGCRPFQGWASRASWVASRLVVAGCQGVLLRQFCFLWFRATFPRYRYDQIMRLGWKVFIPITIVWIVVAALMAYAGCVRGGR